MRRVVVLDSARQDFRDILRYSAESGEGLAFGEVFVRKVIDRCSRIASLPGTLGTARPDLGPDIRSTPYRSYVIFFRYADDAVEIINILHGSRDVIAYYGESE